jgi:hypothetical protein
MFGQFLSNVVKVASCPVDILESVGDVLIGGDGSKRSKQESGLPALSQLRDGACKGLEDLDG